MLRATASALLLALVSLAPAATAQSPAAAPAVEADWSQRLIRDLTAMKAAIEDSHPGPVDTENPSFRWAIEQGFDRALQRTLAVDSQGGWWWALREYEAIFEDGHLTLSTTQHAPPLPTRWPGFLTRFEGREQVVAVRLDQAGLPPMGARLISCDGHTAWRLAEENVGRFRGRWSLAAQRRTHGPRLFIDASNPWIELPRACLFEENGRQTTYRLAWRDLPSDQFGSLITQAQGSFRAPIERRAFGDGGVWISAGDFSGDPGSETARRLRPLIDGLKADQAALRAAPVVVLDLRGNGGGSSAWGHEMAGALWGEAWITARQQGSTAVDWRVSDANIAEIDNYATAIKADPSAPPMAVQWVTAVLTGLRAAKAQGLALWRQADDEAPAPAAAPAASLYSGRVYVLTDAACASACLDTVDLWKAAGAVQIGTESSADTLYMEIRQQPLPSGLAVLNLPMKVYRGRPRGLNEPHRPEHLYSGDMADTAALEAWVRTLR